jgi:hypothetical protein
MNETFSLEMPGPIVAAVRTTFRQKWVDPRYKRYAAWKRDLRIIADARGWPSTLDPKGGYSISVMVYWKRKARSDLDNAGIKNVLDGLFHQDRRVMDIHAKALEHTGTERLSISMVRMI